MIAYTEKGTLLHEAIRAAGHQLWQVNGTWASTNDAAVQAIIDAFDPLTQPRSDAIRGVKALLATKITAGFTYGGHVYQIDGEAQANMTAIKADFLDGRTNAHGGFWRSKANVDVPMTDAEVQAFFSAAKDWKLATVRRAWELIAAISAAANQATLDGININTGWPP